MSAANAGAATETASAAATDNTTFLIESAPLVPSARTTLADSLRPPSRVEPSGSNASPFAFQQR
jgi:hypothetical protein